MTLGEFSLSEVSGLFTGRRIKEGGEKQSCDWMCFSWGLHCKEKLCSFIPAGIIMKYNS